MKVSDLAKELSPIGLLAQDYLSGVATLSKEILTRIHVCEDKEDKISYWQLILLQSKANGCVDDGDDLPQINWQWPKNTWFQQRLNYHLRISDLRALRGAN